jgi:hypothetical protein
VKDTIIVKCNSSHHEEFNYAVLLPDTFDMHEPDDIMRYAKLLRKLSETVYSVLQCICLSVILSLCTAQGWQRNAGLRQGINPELLLYKWVNKLVRGVIYDYLYPYGLRGTGYFYQSLFPSTL